MEKSETIKEIAAALNKFQGGIGKVKKEDFNPAFKKNYAGLGNIIDTIQKPLADAGLSYSQFPDGDGLTTILMHISGEWMASSYKLTPESNTPQKWGSAITYARRYALSGILGLATEEDDDGNAASTPATKSAPAKQPAPKAPTPLAPAYPNWKQAVEYLRLNGEQAWQIIRPRYSITPEHEKQLLTESKQAQ